MKFKECDFELVEKKIKYKFKDISYLKMALTHSSYVYENGLDRNCSNERLEFLGDSIFGFIMAKMIYDLFPEEDEGTISKIKSYWISSKVLSQIAKEIGIGGALVCGIGEEKSGGLDNAKNLANAFEALLAAVYLDGGLKKAEKVISRIFEGKIKEAGKNVILFDFKTRLQEIYQKKYKDKPTYITEPVNDHYFSKAIFREKILGSGKGLSKKEAEQEAAKNALKKIESRKRGF